MRRKHQGLRRFQYLHALWRMYQMKRRGNTKTGRLR